jgi:hypothetical protein
MFPGIRDASSPVHPQDASSLSTSTPFPPPSSPLTPLNSRASRKSRLVITVLNPINHHTTSAYQPEQGIHQINPDRILHPLNPNIISPCVDVHFAEDAKECDPEDKQDQVPSEEEGDSRGERDEVQCCGDGGEGCGYFSVDLENVIVSTCLVW